MLPNSNTHLFTSRLGLETQRTTNPKRVREERKSNHARSGGVWDHVEIVREHSTSPQVKCKHCSEVFCGGATRIRQHFCDKCTADTPAFLEWKLKMLAAADEKKDKKEQKTAERAADEDSEDKMLELKPNTMPKMRQQGILSSMGASTATELDDAIFDLFAGCNIDMKIVDHPLFKKVITLAKTAPASYKTPERHAMCVRDARGPRADRMCG